LEAQHLAEFVCRRIAKKQKIELQAAFWRSSTYWEKQYKQAIVAAYSILKIYSFDIILKALNRKEAWWITSLRCKQLHDLCRDEQSKLSVKETSKIIEISDNTTSVPQVGLSKKNKISKLK